MPWSGGTYSRSNGTYSGSTVWQSDAAAAVKIRADRHDTHDQDLATGINNCLAKDGQNSPSANIGWGSFKITSLGDGTAAADAATYGQTITALAWSGATITGTRSAGNLTITVTAANITSSLGYTPANKAGDTFTGNTVFDLTGDTTSIVQILSPGNSPTGSFLSFTSPAAAPGIVAQYGSTKRRDIIFNDTGIQFAVSTATTAVAAQFTFSEAGAFSATSLSASGTITTGGLEVGYRKVPLTVQNAAYTFTAADAGKGIQHTDTTARTYTVNNSVFAAGDVVSVQNDTGSGAVTIAAGTGVTLYLAGTTTTGNRTVAARGVATIFFASASVAYVSGSGVS